MLAAHQLGDDIGSGHHLALGHRGAPSRLTPGRADELERRDGRTTSAQPHDASYTTSSDVTQYGGGSLLRRTQMTAERGTGGAAGRGHRSARRSVGSPQRTPPLWPRAADTSGRSHPPYPYRHAGRRLRDSGARPVPALPVHQSTSPPQPSGPTYSARVALSCERAVEPGQMLHALQELRSAIDDRLRGDLGGRYDGHSAQSAGTDQADGHLHAPRRDSCGRHPFGGAGRRNSRRAPHGQRGRRRDLSGVALVVRAQ